MSFDMVILRPIGADVTDLADVEDVIDFGAHESVTASLESVFLAASKVPFPMIAPTLLNRP